MTDNKYGDQPLGKSVEEVEAEAGNPKAPGEVVRAEEDAAVIPAIVNANTSGTPGAVVNVDALMDQGGGPDNRVANNQPARENSDSSEE